MASTSAVLLLLFAGLFTVKAGDDCWSYFNRDNKYISGFSCDSQQCCGTCDDRYCCSEEDSWLSDLDQIACNIKHGIVIGSIVGLAVILIILVILICCCCSCCTCCTFCACCPCCCILQMCRKPRPVAVTHVTAITNTASVVSTV